MHMTAYWDDRGPMQSQYLLMWTRLVYSPHSVVFLCTIDDKSVPIYVNKDITVKELLTLIEQQSEDLHPQKQRLFCDGSLLRDHLRLFGMNIPPSCIRPLTTV